nr:hypothetical protein GCM10020092_028800 [Actinoplanes digitatis]
MAISGSRTSLTWVLCQGALKRASRARTRRPVGALARPKPLLGSSAGESGWVVSMSCVSPAADGSGLGGLGRLFRGAFAGRLHRALRLRGDVAGHRPPHTIAWDRWVLTWLKTPSYPPPHYPLGPARTSERVPP